MRIMRFVLGAVSGAILATAVSWGGLYLYGRVLPAGSLFDADPQSANLFFAIWLVLAAVLSVMVGYLTSRR
jgi:hypothetical protein